MSSSAAAPPLPDALNSAAAQTSTFFESLLGHAPGELHSLLWTLQDKRSTWVSLNPDHDGGPELVAGQARMLAESGKDVYVAVSLAAQQGMHDSRIKSANAAGIMGLWADIDIATPDVHKKWNLPPDIDSAMALLHSAQVEPTLIVHSGHGLQAWWLFKEFWAFESEEDRLGAGGLAQRWNNTLQYRAAEKQWVVDSTFDLARVMRVPGTLNRKGSPVVPVRLLHTTGPRYNPDDIEPYCVDASFLQQRGLSPSRSYQPDEFEISDANKLDFERFQALRDNLPTFEATWDMKRKDFTDQSPSSYDLSLATQAAGAGWSDKEIAALILAFRRNHKLDVSKALRTDYIRRTLSRARDGIARDQSAEALDEVGEALDEAKASGDPDRTRDARRSALDVIGQQLGMEVLHFIKYLSDPPQFAVVTPTATIPLGGSDGILVWAKFKAAVWESVGHQIERFKPSEWDRVTRLIPRAWEEQDVGAEATERGEVAAWLAQYLSQRPPVDTLEEAASSEYPFNDENGRVVLFGPAFRRWLYLTYQERVTNKELGRRLRAFGCEPDKLNVADQTGKRTTRGIWRLPPSAGQGVG
jgi:hypothetical protein